MAIKITQAQRKTQGIISIIYGLPGVGKTTFAASGEDCILLDFEGGAHRSDFVVHKGLPVATAADIDDFRDLIELKDGPYKTIVVDTLAAFVDWAIVRMPRSEKQGNGALKLQGYGTMKRNLENIFSGWKLAGISLIFLAHEQVVTGANEEKYRSYRGGVGSTSDIIEAASDLIGYLYLRDGKRYLSAVSEGAQYAKDSLGLGVRDISELSYSELIAQVQGEKAALDDKARQISHCTDAEALNRELQEYLLGDKSAVIRTAIWERGKALGVAYDKERRAFVANNPAPNPKPKPGPNTAPKPSPAAKAKAAPRPQAKAPVLDIEQIKARIAAFGDVKQLREWSKAELHGLLEGLSNGEKGDINEFYCAHVESLRFGRGTVNKQFTAREIAKQQRKQDEAIAILQAAENESVLHKAWQDTLSNLGIKASTDAPPALVEAFEQRLNALTQDGLAELEQGLEGAEMEEAATIY